MELLKEPLVIGTNFVTLNSKHVLTLKDYLYLPNVVQNAVSIPRLLKDGYELPFSSNECYTIIITRLLERVLW